MYCLTAINSTVEKRESAHRHMILHDVTWQGTREETPVDMDMARREAQELYDAGEKQWGTDESQFNLIIGNRSFPQLRATFDEYAKVRGLNRTQVKAVTQVQ